MEALKDYVRKAIDFENQRDLEGIFFERALSEALDNMLIYYSDCKEFFEIDPQKVMALASENGWEVDPTKDSLHQITDYAREGLSCLVYNHMYSELEKAYKEAQRLSKEEFLENDFDTNIDLLIDNEADNLYSDSDMKEYVKEELDNNNFLMVRHLVEALEEEAPYYLYDWSMGTLEDPTPLKDNEDLLSIAEDMGLIKED